VWTGNGPVASVISHPGCHLSSGQIVVRAGNGAVAPSSSMAHPRWRSHRCVCLVRRALCALTKSTAAILMSRLSLSLTCSGKLIGSPDTDISGPTRCRGAWAWRPGLTRAGHDDGLQLRRVPAMQSSADRCRQLLRGVCC
jgi:hypothetical protein